MKLTALEEKQIKPAEKAKSPQKPKLSPLTPEDHTLMAHIERLGESTAAELGRLMGVTRCAGFSRCNKLKKRGLLVQMPQVKGRLRENVYRIANK